MRNTCLLETVLPWNCPWLQPERTSLSLPQIVMLQARLLWLHSTWVISNWWYCRMMPFGFRWLLFFFNQHKFPLSPLYPNPTAWSWIWLLHSKKWKVAHLNSGHFMFPSTSDPLFPPPFNMPLLSLVPLCHCPPSLVLFVWGALADLSHISWWGGARLSRKICCAWSSSLPQGWGEWRTRKTPWFTGNVQGFAFCCLCCQWCHIHFSGRYELLDCRLVFQSSLWVP